MTIDNEVDNNDIEEFFKQHHKYVLNFFKSRLGQDNAEAEDLAQDVIYKAWESYPKFQGRSSVVHWVHRIASNKYLDYYRRKKIVNFYSIDAPIKDENGKEWSESLLVDEDIGPEETAINKEVSLKIKGAVDGLKKHHREVIELHYYKSMEVEQIAKELNIPNGTVKSRLFRARENLGKVLPDILRELSDGDEEYELEPKFSLD